jgi:hypothetical protein
MSDQYDHGYCDVCDQFHDNGCPVKEAANTNPRVANLVLDKFYGLDDLQRIKSVNIEKPPTLAELAEDPLEGAILLPMRRT